ncbi:hypothetical protein OS493_034630 [Desmophyllum pertusum]|uniref:Uncharacterized protein n=1 Tax=Desmophyllum pertusum TaxID=174260 RepID=A0A9X0D2I6_9CNID|nr:hypothetical protein OS493_034630 [Desmophyllum pertusum]
MSTSSAPVENNFNLSSVGKNDMPGGPKSYVQTPISPITSKATLDYKNVSDAYSQSIAKADMTASQLFHFSSELTGLNHTSSFEDKQKRVEIPDLTPFAGGLLEQIKILHSSPTLKQQISSTDTVPGSTPISGMLLEQISRLHASPRQPLGNISGISSKVSNNLNSSIPKLSASRNKSLGSDREKHAKETSIENLQPTIALAMLVSSYNQIVTPPTSTDQNSAKYPRTSARYIQGKSKKHFGRISSSSTSLILQSTPSSTKKDLGERPSPLQRTEHMRVTKPTPSMIIKPLEIKHGNISTPVLATTPASKRLQSHLMEQGRTTLIKKPSRTVKATLGDSVTVLLPKMTTKSRSTEKTGHDEEKAGMFGYFAKLLKSIKDILTKKNSKHGETSSAALLSSGATQSFHVTTTATSVLSDLTSTPFSAQQQQQQRRGTTLSAIQCQTSGFKPNEFITTRCYQSQSLGHFTGNAAPAQGDF